MSWSGSTCLTPVTVVALCTWPAGSSNCVSTIECPTGNTGAVARRAGTGPTGSTYRGEALRCGGWFRRRNAHIQVKRIGITHFVISFLSVTVKLINIHFLLSRMCKGYEASNKRFLPAIYIGSGWSIIGLHVILAICCRNYMYTWRQVRIIGRPRYLNNYWEAWNWIKSLSEFQRVCHLWEDFHSFL